MLSDHIIKNVLKPDGCVIVANLINSQFGTAFHNITVPIQPSWRSCGYRP